MQITNRYRVKAKSTKAPSTLGRVGVYGAVRILTISITIILGVFFTVIVANKNNGIDISITERLFEQARREIFDKYSTQNTSTLQIQDLIQQRHEELMAESGLNDPFLIKHIRWTWDALQLNLGEAVYTRVRATYWIEQDRDSVRNAILDRFPNTLLIIGLADFFVFVIGIPLALYLSRNYGGWFDKIINVLSPLSSVPSWVHGVLLILIFSITFKLLPPGSMVDIPLPDTRVGMLVSRARHMILPVTAIFLSLLFQLVYSWRNYFMIYSEEDYVEFATAMGLSPSKIQNNYILRPSLPYVLTSFALTLVSFWQMATALEIVFDWDGIGKLYIISLPNFWGETMFPGEMGLTIGIVVLFAYLLGIVVFLLDIAYAFVDPRIRLGGNQERIRATRHKKQSGLTARLQTLFSSGEGLIARLLTLAVILVVVGMLLGMTFGWRVWPAQTAEATPADLHNNFKADYLMMVLDSFHQTSDSAQANMRLDALGINVSGFYDELNQFYADDPDYQTKINFFYARYNPIEDQQAGAIAEEQNYILEQTASTNTLPTVLLTSSLLLVSAFGFSFLFFRDRKQIRGIHLQLLSGSAIVIGLVLGIVFSAWVWPVQITNAAPADMNEIYRVDYLHMVMDSYADNGDNALARMRLDALGEYAADTLRLVVNNPDLKTSNTDAIQNFANNFNIRIPPAVIADITDAVRDEDDSSNLSQTGGLNSQTILIAGGAIGVLIAVGGIAAVIRNRKKREQAGTYTKIIFVERVRDWQKKLENIKIIIIKMSKYKSAVVGLVILALLFIGSIYAVIVYPYNEIGMSWYTDASDNSHYIPKTAKPVWVNFFRRNDLPETIILDSTKSPETKTVEPLENGNNRITLSFTFDYPYHDFPSEGVLYFNTAYKSKKPFATIKWLTPDGREFTLKNFGIEETKYYRLDENIDMRQLASHQVPYKYADNDLYSEPVLNGLFMDPETTTPRAIPGQYTLLVEIDTFEPETDVDLEMVLMGKIYGFAGTDFMRRDLVVPLLWGMPFALGIGLVGAFVTTIVSMLFAAFGVWYGGWADNLVQRVTEANMILPVVAIAVLFYAFFGTSLWTILTIIVVLNAFGSPTKTFRAAFIQVKQSAYIEAAQAYGAPNKRIIFRYMIPRILPVMIPQLVTLVPGYIFLEATLGMFNVKSVFPTWGKVIYQALSHGAAWGSRFWVLEPISLLLLTGFAFSMMGFALDRVLNPRLQNLD